MIKRNKLTLIISSIVTLLPMLLGVFGDKLLPEKIIIHWGLDGKPDGWSDPSFAFLILPLVLLAIHWLCVILSVVLGRKNEQNVKLMRIVLWIIPAISLSICAMMVMVALGYTSSIFAMICLLLGVMFIVIGNYLPKTTRNLTAGIKLKWTYSSDENWNATHRFSGKVYVVTGFLCFFAMPLPSAVFPFVAVAIILVAAVVPTVYSYAFYRKQLADGRLSKDDFKKSYKDFLKKQKGGVVVTVILVAVLAIVFPFLMFTGKIETTLGDTSLTVKASFGGERTIAYDHIETVEYREQGVTGERLYGFASARLLHGTFRNDELGAYQRYTYTGNKPCIVLTLDNDIVVLGASDEQELRDIYDRISEEIS